MTTRSGRLKSSIAAPSRRNSGLETTANWSRGARSAMMRSTSSPAPIGTVDLTTTTVKSSTTAGDLARRVIHGMHVGRADLGERRRADGDEDRLRAAPASSRLGREGKPPRRLIGEHQLAQSRLVDRDVALAKARDLALIDLDADDLMAEIGETGPRDEADIARPDHHNAHR